MIEAGVLVQGFASRILSHSHRWSACGKIARNRFNGLHAGIPNCQKRKRLNRFCYFFKGGVIGLKPGLN